MEVLRFIFATVIVFGFEMLVFSIYQIISAKSSRKKQKTIVAPETALYNLFVKSFDYKAVATRAELLWVIFPYIIFLNTIKTLMLSLHIAPVVIMVLTSTIFSIPLYTLIIRRMHDIGKSAWCFFSPYFILGALVILVPKLTLLLFVPAIFLILPTKDKNNSYIFHKKTIAADKHFFIALSTVVWVFAVFVSAYTGNIQTCSDFTYLKYFVPCLVENFLPEFAKYGLVAIVTTLLLFLLRGILKKLHTAQYFITVIKKIISILKNIAYFIIDIFKKGFKE